MVPKTAVPGRLNNPLIPAHQGINACHTLPFLSFNGRRKRGRGFRSVPLAVR